jgi:hypothetical protein
MWHKLPCAFSAEHFISNCLVCQSYIADGKCKKNAEGKVVLPSGQYCPHSIPWQSIKDQINEWHKRNPTSKLDSKILATFTSSLMMYEISPIVKINSSDFAAAKIWSQLLQPMSLQWINVLLLWSRGYLLSEAPRRTLME